MRLKPRYQTTAADVFEEIFRDTKDRLYHFVFKLTRNNSDTQDILQESYSRLWEKLDSIDLSSDVLPLLLTYARNCFIDHLRKRERDQQFLDTLATDVLATEAAAAELSLDLQDKEKLLRVSLEQLPAKRRQIFGLVKEQGLSHKEVAEQLGIATGTVEKQVGLSLQFLRKELNCE
jgi:RNA polymerase sigma-70 factor (ECF subfamily)